MAGNNPHQHETAALILRWGLAFVLLYESFLALLYSRNWLIYFPRFVTEPLAPNEGVLVPILAVSQIALAAWLVWGKRSKWAAGIIAFAVFIATLFNLHQLDLIYRDIGLGLAALALWVLLEEK
jgi:hypothetical protein